MEDLTDDLTNARHISEIIVSCCLVNPNGYEIYETTLPHAFRELCMKGRRSIHTCGSCAEFYIDPIVSCVGDIDLMFSLEGLIAVFDDSTVDFIVDVDETTDVWLLEASECPKGYVCLRKIGETIFNWVTGQIEYFVSNNRICYLTLNLEVNTDRIYPRTHQGPAHVKTIHSIANEVPYVRHVITTKLPSLSTLDDVPCVRLLGWPSVTKSWPTRDRSYAWPCSAVISEVLLNGCDLVYVSHRDYKHDIHQWRYSFSRAEVILIRSWTPIQQIVYHLLRYVVKQTIIREWKNDDKVICTYHLKTLMLWACERKSPVWWESNCVLELCSKLLKTLMKWIMKKHCPHYFMPEWNLLDFTMKQSRYVDTIDTLRILVYIRNLSEWFRINYVSNVFNSFKFDNLDHQRALEVYAASNVLDNEFNKVLHDWIAEEYSYGYNYITHDIAMLCHYECPSWNARQFIFLISTRQFVPDIQFLNLGVASLRLAWNISRKTDSELTYLRLELRV